MVRVLRRISLVGALGVAAALLVPHGAGADTVPVAGGSWYWQAQQSSINPGNGLPPVALPSKVPNPDVPAGDFAVSMIGGQPDKETFLHVDSSAIPQGSTVTSLKLALKEDSGGLNVNQSGAKITAYAVTGYFSDGTQSGVWAERPAFDDKGAKADGARASDGTWTFDLTSIASKWADGSVPNNGIALAPTGGDPFEVVWSGKSPAPSTTGSVTPGVASAPPPAAAPPPDVSGDTNSAPATIPITADTSAPAALPLATPAVTPSSVVRRQRAAPTAIAPRTRRIAEGRPHHGLPWPFFLGVAAVVAFVVLGSISLGQLGDPLPARHGSVLRALERRTAEGTA